MWPPIPLRAAGHFLGARWGLLATSWGRAEGFLRFSGSSQVAAEGPALRLQAPPPLQAP